VCVRVCGFVVESMTSLSSSLCARVCLRVMSSRASVWCVLARCLRYLLYAQVATLYIHVCVCMWERERDMSLCV